MPATVYRASLASVIITSAGGVATPLGIAQGLTIAKQYTVEGLPEIGSFEFAELVDHGYSATFNIDKMWVKGVDFVNEGIVPADQFIAQHDPFTLTLIDQEAQRILAIVYKGKVENYTLTVRPRATLMQAISGIAISARCESELN
jgi:hypothetical protein